MTARRFALCIGLLCLPVSTGAQSLEPQTTWINDHAQFVIESIDAEGKLTGTYTNFGPSFSCAGRAFPVTGWVDGDKISFAVRRRDPANCTPIQSFTGFVREGELLAEFLATATEGRQAGLLKGSDRYWRQ